MEFRVSWMKYRILAAVVESADTPDLKSVEGNFVRVQVSSAAPEKAPVSGAFSFSMILPVLPHAGISGDKITFFSIFRPMKTGKKAAHLNALHLDSILSE